MRAHPQLHGLIFLCPGEAYNQPPLLVQAHDVGGPVGTVHYYRHNKELRLGQPLTITKANVDQYAGQPCPPETPWPC